MRTGTCIRRLLAASGLALALLPGHALAQNALGDGTALDRNLQRGGLGRNTRVRDVGAEIRYQNAIVTGNAPGGLSFRGNTGYTAPEDFRGRLGSNDIFPFIRETALPAAAAANNQPTSSVLTYQNAVPGFTGANRPLIVERSGVGAIGADIGQLPSAAQVTTQRALRPVIIGAGRTRDGRDVALAASPLLGLRAFEAGPPSATGATGATPTTPGAQPGELRGVTTEPGTAPDGSLEQTAPPGATAPPADMTGARLERQTWTFTGLETVARGARAPERGPAPGSPEALALQTPTTLASAEQRSDAYRNVMDRLRLELSAGDRADSRADQRAGAEAAPDRAPSLGFEGDLTARLDRLRRQLTGEPEPETQTAQPPTPAQPAPGGEPSAQQPGQQPRPTLPDVSPPSVKPTIPGVAPQTANRNREQDREAMRRAGIQDPISAALDPGTVEALKRSRTTVRDLRTPSVAENLAYAENMAAGQAFLADGRYFDAEERFVRAAGSIPGDTMASVGRIHSQIGAGLYMSASMNLRTLLSVHPELVATRYAPELLPASTRWGTIRGQLQSRASGEDPGAARAAALLLAYLGYQMGDQEATRAGLTALRDTAELDVPSEAAFVELLTQVWKDAPPVSPAPAPAPAGENK